MSKTLIVIAGPTAIGKTTLAIKLAQYYNTEIISADSRQFYREMEIGTAKPSSEELQAAKHHFINSHSVTDKFSVGDYEREVLELINLLFKNHNVLILAGGSGLFINAVINGFDEIPPASSELREKFNLLYKENGISILQQRLKEIDPAFYDKVDTNNPQRLIRALEVFAATGKPMSQFQNKIKKQRPFDIIQIGLNIERQELYNRINHRVDLMILNGLIQEVEGLQSIRHLNPLHTVGYTELFHYFDGTYAKEEAIVKIKQNTRRFAKRQLTWFTKSENLVWFNPDEVEKIVSYLDSQLSCHGHVEQRN